MKIFKLKDYCDIKEYKDTVCVIGMFDGLHAGHQFLIEEAKRTHKPIGILSFNSTLKNNDGILLSLDDKYKILKEMGITYVFEILIDDNFKKLSPLSFILNVLNKFNFDTIYVGDDFRFGFKASGDTEFLEKFIGKPTRIKIIKPLIENNKKISSRDIKVLIKDGKINEANNLLNRKYMLKGEVIHGLQNGKTIGFPTLNLKIANNYVIPKNGVYKTAAKINNKLYLSMTNIGYHPTIDKLNEISIETNVFDFNEDVYGLTIELYFIDFIRDEKEFKNIDELKKELGNNRDFIKKSGFRNNNTVLIHLENKNNEYLMMHKNKRKNDYNLGKYVGIGGHIEYDESPEKALVREVKEETSLNLNSFRKRAKVKFINDGFSETMHIYESNDFDGTLSSCDEGDMERVNKFKIFDLPIREGDRVFLEELMENDEYFELNLYYVNNVLQNYKFS